MKIITTVLFHSLLVLSSIPESVSFGNFNGPNISSGIVFPETTQHLTEMSTRKFPDGKGRPARLPDNLTALCEPIV
jgi:hypothetical protein